MLGQLAEADEGEVELRLLSDADYADYYEVVENELIDQYLEGALSADEHTQLEQHFLNAPERRDDLAFSAALRKAAQENLSDKQPAMHPALPKKRDIERNFPAWLRRRRALAFSLAFSVLLIGSVLLWRVFSGRNSSEQVVAIQEQRSPTSQNENVRTAENNNQDKVIPGNQVSLETAQPRIASNRQANGATHPAESLRENRRPAASTFAVALEPGSLRSETSYKKFSVPEGTKTVLLTLHFNDDEAGATRQGVTYEVELQNGEIKTIHQAANLRSSAARGGGHFVSVSVPARLLSAGNYHVVLRERGPDGKAESVGSYYFSIAEGSPP